MEANISESGRNRYLLHGARVRAILDRAHYSHARAAQHLGISRAYWSQLVNRRRPLTADMRHLLLSSRLFQGTPEDQLWERKEER